MTGSGLRWIDYSSGVHNRVEVAARRAVMTGFRQIQGLINEHTAKELGTDSYEVTWHAGARPTHQPWQGKVWTMKQLQGVCGLGEVTGLHGANCYHDYNPFIPGVSVRTYTDDWLDAQNRKENTPKTYLGKQYTTYEALQRQRKMETVMRKYRRDMELMKTGGAPDDDIVLKQARYRGKMQEYQAFSRSMGLPVQVERVYQDGLGGVTRKNFIKTGGRSGFAYENKPVYFDKKNDYSICIEGYSAEVCNGLSKAAKNVAKKGSIDRFEHMYLVNLDSGELVFYESNKETDSVGRKFWSILNENPNIKYAFVHNHNIVSSLSLTDLETVITTENLPIMIAVQNDGVKYIAERKERAVIGYYADIYYEDELKELNQRSRNGKISPSERIFERERIITAAIIDEFFCGKVVVVDGKRK